MEKLYKAKDYVEMLYTIKDHLKTYYGYGACGAPADYKYVNRSYEDNRQRYGVPNAPAGSFIFDCAGFAYKAIPWGFCGDPTKCYGGAVWPAKGQPLSKLDTNDILSICTDVSDDFLNIQPAEVLYIPGHVGIYAGNGLALECTSGWNANKVIETQVLNVNNFVAPKYARIWQKHGKLPFIDYEAAEDPVDCDNLIKELNAAEYCLNSVYSELDCIKDILENMSEQINQLKGVLK